MYNRNIKEIKNIKDIDYIYCLFNFLSKNTKIISAIKKLKKNFGLKSDDIILSTFPKSGTTWLRFIFANLISIKELGGIIVDYKILNGELRGNFDINLYPTLKYSSLPRIISTHFVYNSALFGKQRTIYLYRNPADVMVSFYEYRKGLKNSPESFANLSEFIRSEKFGVESWCKHFISWYKKATYVLSYEELKIMPLKTLKNLLEALEIYGIKDKELIEAIDRSNFNRIRSIEEQFGLDEYAKRKHIKGFKFARKGIVGDWINNFNKDDFKYLISKLEEHKLDNIIAKYYKETTLDLLKK